MVLQRDRNEYSHQFNYQSLSIFTPNKTDITNLWSDYCSIWKQISLVCTRSGEWGRLEDRRIIIVSHTQQSVLVHLSVSAMYREFLFCLSQLCYAVHRDRLSSSTGKQLSLQIWCKRHKLGIFLYQALWINLLVFSYEHVRNHISE